MANLVNTNTSTSAISITPSDSTTYEYIRAVYVGTAGNLAVTLNNGNITFVGVYGGQVLPIQPSKILSTGTTASNIIALL